jgi:rhodanese-related sulfurtransferase
MMAQLMGLPVISPERLNDQVDGNRVTVVDVNSDERFRQGHVPGALHLNGAEYTEADLPADKTSAVVFYCSNALCRKAPNAARRAMQMGYTDVRVMASGIRGWLAKDLPTEGSR